MKITMSIRNVFTAFYSSRYLSVLLTVIFALVLLERNGNGLFVVFITSLTILALYLTHRKSIRWIIFALFVFITASPHILAPCVITDITCRWQTISGKNMKEYHFKFSDLEKSRKRFGDIPLFIMIEGKKLENMDYSIKGAEIAGKTVTYPYMTDIFMKIPIRNIDNADMELILKARPGTEFQLFRGTEVCGRDLFLDTVYLMQETETVRIIYYPKLKEEFEKPFPSRTYPSGKNKK